MAKVSTIDVQAKEWFDRTYGNSYFSARIVINFGMEGEKTLLLPMQYGYGDYYLYAAAEALDESGDLPNPWQTHGGCSPLRLRCRDAGIILRHAKEEKCSQRAVKAWGKE